MERLSNAQRHDLYLRGIDLDSVGHFVDSQHRVYVPRLRLLGVVDYTTGPTHDKCGGVLMLAQCRTRGRRWNPREVYVSAADVVSFGVQGRQPRLRAAAHRLVQNMHPGYQRLVRLQRHVREHLRLASAQALPQAAAVGGGGLRPFFW